MKGHHDHRIIHVGEGRSSIKGVRSVSFSAEGVLYVISFGFQRGELSCANI